MSATSSVELDTLRHSAAHLLAAAVTTMWPDAKLAIGPAIPNGFYYDIAFSQPLAPADLERIEKTMHDLAKGWQEFTHREVSAAEARDIYKDNPFKLELIDEIVARGEKITLYTVGEFTDLCRGGHVKTPAKTLKHFKLLSLAGAYWRGDEKNAMLTRIYGTAFASKQELVDHVRQLEEAKKRDHRKLGKQLDLFVFSPLVGSGLPLFTPRGTTIRVELEKYLQSLQKPLGYEQVTIPHLAKGELYKTSGHWDKFKENLFYVKGRDDEFVIKPMNCPHHTQLYGSRQRSYRELPVRFAETTTVYRDEKAGELLGLARVRSITQDDAHVFCTPEQLGEEITTVFSLIRDFYSVFDFKLEPHLSLRDPAQPEKYLGDNSLWDKAEAQLVTSLDAAAMEYQRDEGEAAFYGPKIDFVAHDSLGRTWQLATIQLDFNMPSRFGLTYKDETGSDQMPILIHRAITGSLERFMAILLEHYNGHLPLWLSPTQVAVLPISDDQLEYAKGIERELVAAGVRAQLDDRGLSIGKKIRESEVMRVPVMFIVGKREVEGAVVAVRSHANGDEGSQNTSTAIQNVVTAISERTAA